MVNRITVNDPKPITTAEKLFQKLEKCQFSRKSIWAMVIGRYQCCKNGNIHKTIFVTGNGCYQFLKMSFIMKNSGSTLVREMRKFLLGLDHVESYIVTFLSSRKTRTLTCKCWVNVFVDCSRLV